MSQQSRRPRIKPTALLARRSQNKERKTSHRVPRRRCWTDCEKHRPRTNALKRPFCGYVLWRTQNDSNLCSNFALFICAEEALRSVLRALSISQHLNRLPVNHLPVESPSPQLDRNVTIADANSGLVCISIGACDSVRWLA